MSVGEPCSNVILFDIPEGELVGANVSDPGTPHWPEDVHHEKPLIDEAVTGNETQ